MKSILVAILCFIFTLELRAKGPAGIQLYFKDKDTTYLLLADDIRRSKGWSNFGGAADSGETSQQTAARETEEETRGYFKREWLLKQIQNEKPYSSHGFTMYFVEVPFVPALRVQQNPIPLKKKFKLTLYERINFAWIPESEILKAITTGDNTVNPLYLPQPVRSDVYMSQWLKAMKAAYDQKACPWLKTR